MADPNNPEHDIDDDGEPCQCDECLIEDMQFADHCDDVDELTEWEDYDHEPTWDEISDHDSNEGW